jgi:hypothetical protein
MRLLKAQNTNLRSIRGKGIRYNVDEQVVVDSNNSILISKGTSAERPTNTTDGQIRYNTDLNDFEFYAKGAWRVVRYEEPFPQGIVQQNLGNGDASETFFGTLSPVPAEAQNVLVFVENVFQISGTNYSLTQNPTGKPAGWYIQFTSPPDAGKPITVLHNFDK